MGMEASGLGELLPWLAGVAVRGAAVLCVAAAVTVALRRSTAALRHLVWAVALAGVLALPGLVPLVPDVGVRLPALTTAAPADGARPVEGAASSVMAGGSTEAVASRDVADPSTERTPASGAGAVASGTAVVVAPAASGSGARAPDLAGLLVLLWLVGGAVTLAPLATGWVGVRRLERRSRRVEDTRVLHLATRLALRIGLKRELRLLEGPADAMPMTWGILRPVVVLPPAARTWSEARLEAVLLHELAHVKRRDCLTQLVAEVVRAVHWFDPLAWVAARRLRVERELACDDIALAGGARPSAYAGELLGLARSYRASRATTLAAVAMARPGQLAGRLLAVLDEGRRRGAPGQAAVLRTAAALGALTLGIAATAPAAGADRPEHEAEAGSTLDAAAGLAGNDFPAPEVPAPATLEPVAPVAPAQEATCAASREGWRQVQHNSNDERTTISMRREGCELEVRLEGEVQFDGDAVTITRMEPDARVRMEEDDGRVERYLEIRPGPDGAPSYDYRVDRRQAAFDGAAQAWYRAVLLHLFRSAGFAAEERVTALLARGGPEAVLMELGQIESSFVFAKYARSLLEQQRLEEAEARALVRASARRVDSDHYMSEILGAVAQHQPLTGGLLDDFITASTGIDSDHYRTGILRRALEGGRLDGRQAAAVLASAAEMDSDHYLSELLKAVASRYALEAELREPYMRAAARIESDHYLSEVLGTLLDRGDLSDAERAEVLAATAAIESDHYRSELLKDVARGGLAEETLQRAYFQAVAGIESDHYGQEALRVLLRQERLPADLLRSILGAATAIGSDHYLSELLLEVARGFALSGETRDAFLRAMESVESDHYRGQVAEALLRAERGG